MPHGPRPFTAAVLASLAVMLLWAPVRANAQVLVEPWIATSREVAVASLFPVEAATTLALDLVVYGQPYYTDPEDLRVRRYAPTRVGVSAVWPRSGRYDLGGSVGWSRSTGMAGAGFSRLELLALVRAWMGAAYMDADIGISRTSWHGPRTDGDGRLHAVIGPTLGIVIPVTGRFGIDLGAGASYRWSRRGRDYVGLTGRAGLAYRVPRRHAIRED